MVCRARDLIFLNSSHNDITRRGKTMGVGLPQVSAFQQSKTFTTSGTLGGI